jgi:hypothetical protein
MEVAHRVGFELVLVQAVVLDRRRRETPCRCDSDAATIGSDAGWWRATNSGSRRAAAVDRIEWQRSAKRDINTGLTVKVPGYPSAFLDLRPAFLPELNSRPVSQLVLSARKEGHALPSWVCSQ